jgi:CheY-like chemotaxis protein
VNRRVLLVDDEPRLLDGLRRALGRDFDITTATSGAEALERVKAAAAGGDPYAALLTDMQMPGMSGSTLLGQVHAIAPDTVLLVLSGQADLVSMIAAVNDSRLFRFLTKPCPSEDVGRALEDALRQYQLVGSERELIERTLNGAVEVLTELISTSSPLAFARTARVRKLTLAVTESVQVTDIWELRLATMLSQIGCVGVPYDILESIASGQDVTPAEQELYAAHPALAHDMLARIPRLERVAAWVGAQVVDVDEARMPAAASRAGGQGFPGEVVFALVTAFLAGLESGRGERELEAQLVRAGFPTKLVAVVGQEAAALEVGRTTRRVTARQLTTGMVLNQDVVTSTGLTLLRRGEPVTSTLAIRLQHFAGTVGLVEPISVLVDELVH